MTNEYMRRNTKLTESDVMDIKYRIAEGERHTSIARSYDVSPATISKIKLGQRWADVDVGIEFVKNKNFWSYASPELSKMIVKYYLQGYNQREVADFMNDYAKTIPKKSRPNKINESLVHAILVSNNVKLRPKFRLWYPHLLRDMKKMWKQGYNYNAIGKKLGIPRITVKRYLEKK